MIDEIEAARSRQHGQCPHHKGHSVDVFMSGVLVGVFVAFVFALVVGAMSTDYRAEAIKNGNAQYDTITGQWKWIPHKIEASP